MTKIEVKFFDFIKKNIIWFLLAAVTVFGIAIRICGLDFQSGDFQSFLNPWWGQIKAAGIGGLATQVGNYNIPYQIITFILTLFPIEALFAYKLLSIIFDFILAISTALLVKELDKSGSKLLPALAYTLSFCLITVVLNSAFWAQCDSIYVSFIILALYFTFKDKPIPTFIMLGLAFTFKLQAVFIIPVFFFWYVLNRKVSILHFLIIPAVDFVLCLPAVFLGRNIADIFTIYAGQTDYGKLIQMNCPNIYAFICDGNDMNNYYLLKSFSIFLTLLILAVVLCVMIYKRVDLSDSKAFLWTAIWTAFTCIMFLSSMHERYGYLLDLLLIIFALVYKKHIWAAVAANLVSLRGYSYYLFKYEVLDIKWTAVIYTAVYAYVTYVLVKEVILKKDAVLKKEN